jgi:serine/threonine-protein kinase
VHKTATGMMKGKVSYMSPEQCYGKHLDARSDVFSLGIVFWEVLACRHLFKRKSEIETLKSIVTDEPVPVRTYNQEVKSALASIVAKALEKDPQDRFQTARHMGAAVRKYLKKSKAPDFKADIQSFLSAVLPDHEKGRRRMLEEFESPPDEEARQQAFIEVTKEAPQVEPTAAAKSAVPPDREPRVEELFGMSWTEELDVPTQEFILEKKKPKQKAEPLAPEQFVLGVRTDEKDELDVATDRFRFEDLLLEELAAEEQRPITLYPKSPQKRRHPAARMFLLLLLLGLTLATLWLIRTHGIDLYAFVTSLEKKPEPAGSLAVKLAVKTTPEVKPIPPAPEPKPAPEPEKPAPTPEAKSKPPPHPNKPKHAPLRHGFLQVNSTPWTEVYVDDRDVGFTPVVKLKLPVGEHEVRLINEGYQIDKSIVVIIEEGKTYNVLKKFPE